MSGVNKVTLIGNIGRDPEIRETKSGNVLSFSVATNERWGKGEDQQRTTWHRVSVFGKRADALGSFLAKGMQVYVDGRINNQTVEGDDGKKTTYSSVVANDIQVLGSKGSNGQRTESASTGGYSAPAPEVSEDEIPF